MTDIKLYRLCYHRDTSLRESSDSLWFDDVRTSKQKWLL